MDVVGDLRRLDVGGADTLPRRFLRLLEREWLLIAVAAFFCGGAALGSTVWMVSDSWYGIVYGREILEHGLPHADTMTILGRGHPWVDQQWLAHVLLYGLFRAGGAKLVSLATALLFGIAFAAAAAVARRRGASSLSLIIVVLLAWPYMTSWIQAEVFARPLFIALLALLAAESHRPSRRVLLALPMLVLWANLHGTVVIGAALVALLGAVELAQLIRARRIRTRAGARALVLLLVPWLCLGVTPYGFSGLGYYRATVFNSSFHRYINWWQAPTPFSIFGGPFFLLALLTAAVVVGRYRRATAFELAALGLTLLAAAEAKRSVAWFATAAVLLVAPILERERETRWRVRASRLPAIAAVAAIVLGAAAVAGAAARPQASYTSDYDGRAAAAVADYARAHPRARVFANDPFADWLTYVQPSLWGRVAHDARWEQLTTVQIRSLYAFLHEIGPGWKSPTEGYDLVMIGHHWPSLLDAFEHDSRYRTFYKSSRITVFERRDSGAGTRQAGRDARA
jgi:hypothetical protein